VCSCNLCCSGKTSITQLVCVFEALCIQHAKCMCHIVICGQPHSTNFFHIISQTAWFLGGEELSNTKCVFRVSLQLLSEIFFILRRNEWDMIENVYWSSCKVPFILVWFWRNLNTLDRFSISTQISNFTNIYPVGAELFCVDRWTDMMELTVTFCNFAKYLKCSSWKKTPGKSMILKIRHMESKKLTFQKCKLLCFSQMMHHRYRKISLWQKFITYRDKLLFQDSVLLGY